MKKRNLIVFILLLSSLLVFPQNPDLNSKDKPKIVIGIIVDQMSMEYLYRYWDKFENNGFKRLVKEGAICKNAQIPYLYTQSVVGYASLATGTTPSYHGIVGDKWYNRLTESIIFSVNENKYNSTDYASTIEISPKWLLSSTFTDQLKLSTNNQSKVFSIALDAPAAVLNAGHIANAAFWFDENFGNWISGKYYLDSIPKWVKDFNTKKLPDIYLDREWNTLLNKDKYTESTSDDMSWEDGIFNQRSFPYDLKSLKKKLSYRLLKFTPEGNTFTKDFAISTIINEKLGKDEYTDVLYITFSANQYIEKSFGHHSIEIEDTYLRLDKEINHLLDFIDGQLGKQNTLVFLTSGNSSSDRPPYLEKNKIPAGYFKSGSAVYILKTYLNALYGEKELIKYYNQQQIYLNHKQIEDSKLSLTEVQEKCALFLEQYSGIANVITSNHLKANDYSDASTRKAKNSYYSQRSGDLMIILEPGWVEQVDQELIQNHLGRIPLIWYGWKIKSQQITRPVSIIDIAPTLSAILNIPFPNAYTGLPFWELIP